MDNENPADTLLSSFKKEYVIIGAQRMKSWQGWFIIGIMVGVLSGVIWVANRSGQIEGGRAAIETVSLHSVVLENVAGTDMLKVTYSKNFITCVSLYAEAVQITPFQNYFCAMGESITVTESADLFPLIQVGTRVFLRHGNNPSIVSNVVVVTEIPRGVFSLTGGNDPIAPQVLTNPYVAGVSIRSNWKKVEVGLAAGSTGDRIIYDWSYFDSEIARAIEANKKILLRITSGGINTPRRVFDEGVQTFTFIDTNPFHQRLNPEVTIPVFWDPIFLEHKKRFILAMGKHFASNPHIVLVASSCANANTDDWHIPHTPEDIKNWIKVGYTNEKLINACKEIIDTTMSAFPNTFVLMAVGGNTGLDQDPIYVARNVIAYARGRYPGRFFPQMNRLSAKTPDPMETSTLNQWQLIYDARPQVGAQMLWRVTDDPGCRMEGGKEPSGPPCIDPAATLRKAITTGTHYETQYQEIYEIDVINPGLAGVIQYAAQLLGYL